MQIILLLACIGMITGFFVMLSISPMDFTQNIFKQLSSRPQSLKDSLKHDTKRKKESYLKREIAQTKAILEVTGRGHQFPMVCAMSLLFFAIGAIFASLLSNVFLVPVLAIGFLFLPFWYIKLTESHFKRDIASELETALSIITTGYLRSENIVTAIEENVEYLNPPVQSIFQNFLSRIKMVNPDIMVGLQDMKEKMENPVFKEWVDAMILCQNDRSLKSTLTPIVSKLSDMRIVNGELENMMIEPRQEFITMVILVLGNIPLLYFLNKDWYHTLMYTVSGKLIISKFSIFFLPV